MIDVPIQVKDALREGNYRKEYRFCYPSHSKALHTFNTDSESFRLLDAFEETVYDSDIGEYVTYNTFWDKYSTPLTIHAFSEEEKKYTFHLVYPSENIERTVTAANGGDITLNIEYDDCVLYIYYQSPDVNVATPVSIYIDNDTVQEVITNDRLVKESVKIDERLCSADTIKFGLCEGTSLEFECFNVENLKSKTLTCEIVIFYSENESYTLPMGIYIVDSVSRQASTGIFKVTAYNKIKSKYLDAKANNLLISNFDNPNSVITMYDIEDILLDNYQIEKEATGKVSPSSTYGVGEYRKLGGGTIKLKAKYGIDSPINYYMYKTTGAGNTTDTGYLYVVASERKYSLSNTEAYKVKFKVDIEKLEVMYFQRLCDLGVLSFNITKEQFITRLMTVQSTSTADYGEFLGWHNYFGVKVTYNDDTVKWYSKYAYQYGLSNVEGSLKDLENTTIIGAKQIDFYIPHSIFFSQDGTGKWDGNLTWVTFGDDRYSYYTTSDLDTVKEDQHYIWYLLDGSVVTAEWLRSGWHEIHKYDMYDAEKIKVNVSQMPDFTLRDITSALLETQCQFGKLDRSTDLFSGVELNQSRLYPQETLYPSASLYPDGAVLSANKAMYSKLWADEGNIQKWKYLIITYQGTDGNEHTLQRTVNNDGTQNYNCSDNWLFRNLQWTAEQIGVYADAMVLKMRNITWFPFEMWCAGLPYLETGDEIEIPLGENTYTSYILQRNLNGIQNLQDTFINGELDIF